LQTILLENCVSECEDVQAYDRQIAYFILWNLNYRLPLKTIPRFRNERGGLRIKKQQQKTLPWSNDHITAR